MSQDLQNKEKEVKQTNQYETHILKNMLLLRLLDSKWIWIVLFLLFKT